MQKIGQVNDRQVIYVKYNSETAWYTDFPNESWLLLVIADIKQTNIFAEIARRAIDNNIVYICATGKVGENFHDTFDEVIVIRDVENQYLPAFHIMTTWHDNFDEGFWFAAVAAYGDEQEIKTIVCLDITSTTILGKLEDLVVKINSGWVPSEEK